MPWNCLLLSILYIFFLNFPDFPFVFSSEAKLGSWMQTLCLRGTQEALSTSFIQSMEPTLVKVLCLSVLQLPFIHAVNVCFHVHFIAWSTKESADTITKRACALQCAKEHTLCMSIGYKIPYFL